MNALKVMDVTFRDGGYRTAFYFKEADLRFVLSALDKAEIDYVEVGYRSGIHPVDDRIGPSGFCVKRYLDFCRALLPNVKMAVMVYPQNVTHRDLRELKQCQVDLLRICVARDKPDLAWKTLKMAEKIGLNASVNVTNMSKYNEQELDQVVAASAQYAPKAIYFADSNGSMLPNKIQAIYARYTQQYAIPFGFHAHDNLGLAQANAMAAMQAGAEWIDCSLGGLGKGIGNLREEFFIAALQAQKLAHYKMEHLLPAANYIRQAFHTERAEIELSEFLRGISDL